MPKSRTELEIAAGKLISAIQKEWGNELGESVAEVTEQVMGLAHSLLQARTYIAMRSLLGSRSIVEYLGEVWVRRHPSVEPYIESLEQVLKREQA